MLETLIPLYCLTGFVGSGKTTALLSILRQNPDKKIGVIFTEPPLLHRQNIQENEDISIEMLDNGSLQCSCSEDALAQALAYMHRCQPEMVFVEVSGLSDPVHVKKILESEDNAGLMQHYAVQGIICLIDADNFMEQIQDVEMVGRQLCHCHLAVINKADLVAPELLGMLKAQIHRINPDCDIVSCSYGGFSLELLEHTCSPTPPARRRMRTPDACPTRSCSTASTACRGTRWSPSLSASSPRPTASRASACLKTAGARWTWWAPASTLPPACRTRRPV